MLFNSPEFVFIFLPVALVGYYLLQRSPASEYRFHFLILMSLIYYSVWNPPYTLLLCASLGANYLIGRLIQRASAGRAWFGPSVPLAAGLLLNVGMLFYFKYANFFVDNLNAAAGTNFNLQHVLLPLGISFYTFQKIAYLVDLARGEVRDQGFTRFSLFVLFFPQLIAGPIVHFRETSPQFDRNSRVRFAAANITVGLVIFAIGLFKKTVIADTASQFATPIFQAAHQGDTILFWSGWQAAVIYTLQLYFDFSGYSDMAIGLARMFGIKLPLNFHSPLRAQSILDYWRRWHMTLQRFIISYMYQPLAIPLARLAANWNLGRFGRFVVATALPTVAIFFVVGLWHGAGWTFAAFGLMHGAYIVINEAWREINRKRHRKTKTAAPAWGSFLYWCATIAAVLFANVMFRAQTVGDAMEIYAGMTGLNGPPLAAAAGLADLPALLSGPLMIILVGCAIVFGFPNTQQIMRRYGPALGAEQWVGVGSGGTAILWRPTLVWAAFTGFTLYLGIMFIMRAQTEFIYFNF